MKVRTQSWGTLMGLSPAQPGSGGRGLGQACGGCLLLQGVGAAGIPDIERTWARGPLHSAPQHYLTCCRGGGASGAGFQKWGALSSRGVLPSPLHVESRCRVCSVLINFAFSNRFRFAESLQRAACPSARAPPARTPLPGCVRRRSEADSGPSRSVPLQTLFGFRQCSR